MQDLFDLYDAAPQLRPHEPPPAGIPRDVCDLFERLALEVHGRKWKRYSSDAILHRIRWHMHIERGDRSFKCNDHWTAPLARWFLANHPECEGFFELRASPHSEAHE